MDSKHFGVRSLNFLGFDSYSINTRGEIRSYKVSKNMNDYKVLKPSRNQYGKLFVRLYNQEGMKQVPVDRLVALTYLGDQPSTSHIVLHKDLDEENVNLTNLAWRPRSYANRYRLNRSKTTVRRFETPIRCKTTGEVFETLREAATSFGVTDVDMLYSIDTDYPTCSYLMSYRFEYVDASKKHVL